ncbi:MAG TPA: inorganic phosphate transporter [Terriglobales bacterium]|nr:inorganic phosphate transporter [Terriglobales bacterium]
MHTIQLVIWTVILLVAIALIFDFMNGFHDAANSIATVVSTGVLKPHQAVAFAALFNVIAYFVFHLGVAATIGKGTRALELQASRGRLAARFPCQRHAPASIMSGKRNPT